MWLDGSGCSAAAYFFCLEREINCTPRGKSGRVQTDGGGFQPANNQFLELTHIQIMKMRLPKMLAVALMSAMCAGVAYAGAPIYHTPSVSITEGSASLNVGTPTNAAPNVITIDKGAVIEVTGNTSVNGSLYVREGGIAVTSATLTVSPGVPDDGNKNTEEKNILLLVL